MAVDKEIITSLKIGSRFENAILEALRPVRLRTYVDILVVVDPEIRTESGIPFGISSVIDLIRNTKVGCLRFRVDIARRSGATPTVVDSPASFSPKYDGFRFDMTDDGRDVIDRYEQIWCFGFKPDNFGGPDDNIENHPLFATESELAKLASWMKERKGGLFATGDHDYLGASMCSRMPRIGTMRKWTNADGVPPISGTDRIDTLRPPSADFEPGAPGGPQQLTNSAHQGDLTVQPIQWVAWRQFQQSVFLQKVRPHPVLCHPTLGPINVMPDHAHEGVCNDTGTVPLTGAYKFDGNEEQDEYPDAIHGGSKPAPEVIAYGTTLPSPPYAFGKGEQPARRFPMISVYDGHRAGVGRCATDSTWHHWMNVNIDNIKAAGGDDWAKISRYFINLAIWLSPPGYNTRCLCLSTFTSHFQYVGIQEYSAKLSDVELGRLLRKRLVLTYGPCWVTQVVFDLLDQLKLPMVLNPIRVPQVCLSCPPFERLEEAVLGGLVRVSLEEADKIKQAVAADKLPLQVNPDAFDQMVLKGVEPALRELAQAWKDDMSQTEKFLQQML